MSDLLELVESTPESRIAEEVKAMLTAYDQAVAECERLRAEVEAKDKRIAELEKWLADLWFTHRATDLMYIRDDLPEIAKLVEGE